MIVPLTSLPSRLFVVPQDVRLPFGLPVITCPVLSIEKSVVVALAVEDATAKRVVRVSPLLACTESFANGEVEPMLNVPDVGSTREVADEVAASVPKYVLPILKNEFVETAGVRGLYPKSMFPPPVVRFDPPVFCVSPMIILS